MKKKCEQGVRLGAEKLLDKLTPLCRHCFASEVEVELKLKWSGAIVGWECPECEAVHGRGEAAISHRQAEYLLSRAGLSGFQQDVLDTIERLEVASPRMISDELKKPVNNVSYHVKVLKGKGKIRLQGTRPVRGVVEHFYIALEPEFQGVEEEAPVGAT